MLVLSRQRDQAVTIDLSKLSDSDRQKLLSGEEVIEVIVVDIRGSVVRVGATAPKSVQIHRKEIWRAKRREEAAREAAKAAPERCAACGEVVGPDRTPAGGYFVEGKLYHVTCAPAEAGTV